MKLTDEQIKSIHYALCDTTGSDYKTMARAIESTVRQQYEPVLRELVNNAELAHDLSLDGDHHAARIVLKDAMAAAQRLMEN